MDINKNNRVERKWRQSQIRGTVKNIIYEKTAGNIDGSEITLRGCKNDPALYIEVTDSNNVLKLASEVTGIN